MDHRLPNAAGPLLIVLSGPSGAGKDAVLAGLKGRGQDCHFAVTATTREPRADEQDSVDYFFVSEPSFRRLLAGGELIEHEEYANGRLYGTPRAPIAAALAAGRDVVLRTDVRGAQSIKRLAPDAVLVFIYLPEGIAALRRRMESRGSETPDAIERRLAVACTELATLPAFDYALPNDDGLLDCTVDRLQAIIAAEHCRAGRRRVALIP